MSIVDDAASNASSRRSRGSAVGADAANSSKQLHFPEPLTTRILTRYYPMFPLLHTFQRKSLHIVSLFYMLVYAAQRWSFVVNPHFREQWDSVLGGGFAQAFYGFQLAFYDPAEISSVASTTPLLVLVYVALAAVLLMILCIMFHLTRVEDTSEAKGKTAQLARVILSLFSGILFIPAMQLCFSAAICGSSDHIWILPAVKDAKCWGSHHIAAFVAGIVSLVLLLPSVYIKVACVYDYTPLSDNFMARRYSHLDKLTFLHDFSVCFLFNVMNAFGSSLGYAVLTAISSGLLVIAYMHFLPFYSARMNRFYVCVHTVECFGAIFLASGVANHDFASGALMTPLFISVTVIAVILALVLTEYRVNPNFIFAMKRAAECIDAAEVDVPEDTEDAIEEDNEYCREELNAEVNRLRFPRGLATTDEFTQYTGLSNKVSESITRQKFNAALGPGNTTKNRKQLLPVLESFVDRILCSSDVALATTSVDLYARRFGTPQVTPLMLLFATSIYSRALVTFSDDPAVLQSFTSFIITYLPGMSFMGVDLLKRLLRLPTSIDQQFRALKQVNELRVALGIRTHAHSIRSTRARMAHARVLQSFNRFWTKLAEPSVNIKEVSEVADEISVNRKTAIGHFDLALRRQQSADGSLLRRLGDFLAEVLMAPVAAQECYNEANEMKEARQSRTLRGTRAHAIEVDVVALTTRECQLLASSASGTDTTASLTGMWSHMIQYFTAVITIFYLILVACGALFLFIASRLTRELRYLLDGTLATTALRIAASRFGSSLIGFTMTTDAITIQQMRVLLKKLLRSFSAYFEYMSTGDGKVRSAAAKFVMSQSTIPLYDKVVNNQNGFSIHSLSESYLQGMNRVVNDTAQALPTGYSENEEFLMHVGSPLASAYSYLLSLHTTTEMNTLSLKWIIWLVVVFVASMLCLAGTYAGLVLAFRRTSQTRALAFQMFTLIPYEVLEKLATEAKERYHRIHVERSLRRSQDGGNASSGSRAYRSLAGGALGAPSGALGPCDVPWERMSPQQKGNRLTDDKDGAPPAGGLAEAHTATLVKHKLNDEKEPLLRRGPATGHSHSSPPDRDKDAVARDVTLKSCMKSSRATVSSPVAASTRYPRPSQDMHVRFNPVVDVVGDVDGSSKDRRAANPRVSKEDTEDDIDLLLMEQSRIQKAAEKRREVRYSKNARMTFSGTLCYFCSLLVFFIVCTALLGSTLASPQHYRSSISSFSHSLTSMNTVMMNVSYGWAHTFRFISIGSATEFQSAQVYFSAAVQGIPQLMGSDYPLAATTKLTKMHQLAQLIGNVSIDASVLAAKSHGISLTFWADARGRDEMVLSDFLAYINSTYPTAVESVDAIFAYTKTAVIDRKLAYAYALLFEHGSDAMQEYRDAYYAAAAEVYASKMADARLSRAKLGSVIGLSSAATLMSLLFAFTPLRGTVSAYISRSRTVLAAVSFIPVLVLSVVLLTMETAAPKSMSDGTSHPLVRDLNSVLEAFTVQSTAGGFFALSAQPKWWFELTSVADDGAKDTLSTVLVNSYPTDQEAAHLFSELIESWNTVEHLVSIRSALTINAFLGFAYMEAPMLTALKESYWDIEIERDYVTVQVERRGVDGVPTTSMYYTNKSADLALPIAKQYELSMALIGSYQYWTNTFSALDSISALYDRFIWRTESECDTAARKVLSLLYADLACCVFPLLACLYMASSATYVVRLALQMSSSVSKEAQLATASSATETARCGSVLLRVRYTLLCLALLISATFGVGIWVTQTGYVYAREIQRMASLESLVSTSFYHCREMMSSHVTFVSPSMVHLELSELLSDVTDLFNGRSTAGVPIGLRLDQTVNILNFGQIGVEKKLEIVSTYMTDNCSRYLSGQTSPSPLEVITDYNGDLGIPLVQGIDEWVAVMTRVMASTEDYTAQSTTDLYSYMDDMNTVAAPLLAALSAANFIAVEAIGNYNERVSTVLIVLSALTLCGTIVSYFFVMVPTVVRLYREEESLTFLLHMIPPNVRDEVPAISQFLETGQMTNMAELQKKLEANDKLLQNILPQKIAARLKNGELPIADTHRSVTMLFTDFVGFTKRSSTMQAREIVDFLNEVFLEFDTIVEQLGLEKIKTIGDAYFMAGGLDPLMADHALRVVEAALKFFDALEKHNSRHPSRQPLQMRLGVHTGPVIAGVIGTKKVAYDLWGDSVEVANALESTGVPGYVHISEETAKYVRGFFKLRPRGELPKEKEHIPENMPNTFLVIGRELPTPYMHLRRPRLLPTSFREKSPSRK